MKLKFFPGSIIALLLGFLLAAPLLYTNVVIAPDTDSPEPLFGVEVAYAYIEEYNGQQGGPFVAYCIGLNFTRLSEAVDVCDAKLEVYRIEVYLNEGHIENLLKYEGLIHNQSLIGLPSHFLRLFFNPEVSNPFQDNSSSVSAGGGSATTRWPIGESRVTFSIGGGNPWDRTFGEQQTIFMRVSRVGWAMLINNSTETVVLSEPEVVAEVQLESYRDGFLYNNLISEDQLSQLDDPLYPHGKMFDLRRPN